MEKSEDLGIKVGSEDMVFWRDIIDARKLDIEASKKNIKFFEAIVETAERKFKEAEKEFEKCTSSSSPTE